MSTYDLIVCPIVWSEFHRTHFLPKITRAIWRFLLRFIIELLQLTSATLLRQTMRRVQEWNMRGFRWRGFSSAVTSSFFKTNVACSIVTNIMIVVLPWVSTILAFWFTRIAAECIAQVSLPHVNLFVLLPRRTFATHEPLAHIRCRSIREDRKSVV